MNGLNSDSLRATRHTRATPARAALNVSNVSAPQKPSDNAPIKKKARGTIVKPVSKPDDIERYPMKHPDEKPVEEKKVTPMRTYTKNEPVCQEIGSVTTTDDVKKLLTKMEKAQSEFEHYTQEQVDEIFKAVAMEASTHRLDIAQWAHEDTGMGVFEDKVVKNHFASEFIYNKYSG